MLPPPVSFNLDLLRRHRWKLFLDDSNFISSGAGALPREVQADYYADGGRRHFSQRTPAKMRARGKGGAVSASVIQPGRAPAQLAIRFEGRCTRAHTRTHAESKIQPRMPESWQIDIAFCQKSLKFVLIRDFF
jgi:hypothetical protein